MLLDCNYHDEFNVNMYSLKIENVDRPLDYNSHIQLLFGFLKPKEKGTYKISSKFNVSASRTLCTVTWMSHMFPCCVSMGTHHATLNHQYSWQTAVQNLSPSTQKGLGCKA